MFFGGIQVRGWTSMRVKEGETTDNLFALLTSETNAEVQPIHPKAMHSILTKPEEWYTWLSVPFEIAGQLQRRLPDGALRLVEEPL